jgi:hypothetical protein
VVPLDLFGKTNGLTLVCGLHLQLMLAGSQAAALAAGEWARSGAREFKAKVRLM